MRPQRLGTALLLLMFLPLLSCGDGKPEKGADDTAEEAGDSPPSPTAPTGGAPALAGTSSGTGEPAGAAPRPVPVFKKPPPEPADVAVVRLRVIRGDRSVRTLKELQKLSYKYPKNAEVAYILGQLYCTKLWISDCLQHFGRALSLDSAYRDNAFLIRSVVAGLGNDSDHVKVRRFLVGQIGTPAQPYLEEVLAGTWRQQVKDRATATLREIK